MRIEKHVLRVGAQCKPAGTDIRVIYAVSLCLLVLLLVPARGLAQSSGMVSGRILDAVTKEALPGATVRFVNTNLGAASDIEGFYRLNRVPYGVYDVEVRYLGYATLTETLTIDKTSQVKDFELSYDVVMGQEVVIQGQAAGQASALNQQKVSSTIVNVVSADRISEFPDQNAAESIGRLPGIALQRDAGEGQKVVVRGLSPRFNSITINGERIPSTGGNDRSVDLSMISPDILAGIEVFKAVRPDMDADAIGGSINLVIKKAPAGFRGNFRGQLGYNDHTSAFGLPRGSLSVSDRYFEDKLGVLITANAQRANRSSELLSADYVYESGIKIENANVNDRIEIRDRAGASIALDYDITPNHSLFFSTFYSYTERDEVRYRKRYRVGARRTEYDLRDRQLSNNLLSNTVSGNHSFSFAEVDWQFSRSSTKTDEPGTHYSRFQELAAFDNTLIDTQGPLVVQNAAFNALDKTWFQYTTVGLTDGIDSDLTAQFNIKFPYRLGNAVNGYIKTGAKIREKARDRNNFEFQTPFAEIDKIGQENPGMYTMYNGVNILIENFVDPSYTKTRAVNGQYAFGPVLDRDMLRAFENTYRSRYVANRFVQLANYDASESIQAAYLMTEVTLFNALTLLPGFRYEQTSNDYTSNFGRLTGNLGVTGEITDTSGSKRYHEILPMFHVKYQVLPWADIRLAYTKTLSRPDFYNLAPFFNLNVAERILERGNPDTKHTRATNYDLFVSVYGQRVGFFSVGFFYKDVRDVDYIKRIRVEGQEYTWLIEPTNAPESFAKGYEIEWQSNFSFLPRPFNGLILSANYSRIESETLYPFFEIGPRSPNPPFRPILIDTVRVGRMPGQANEIANLTVGYEINGFSGRLSMIYQGNTLEFVGTRPDLDGFTDDYVSWDLSLTQELSFLLNGMSVFFNVNNLSNRPEGSYLGTRLLPTREEYFGWTADGGVRFKF